MIELELKEKHYALIDELVVRSYIEDQGFKTSPDLKIYDQDGKLSGFYVPEENKLITVAGNYGFPTRLDDLVQMLEIPD